MNPYDMVYDLNDEVNKLTRQLEVAKASLSKWEAVFCHLGTPDEVGNEWVTMSDRIRVLESAIKNLAKARGRYNTEIAYQRLLAALEESK